MTDRPTIVEALAAVMEDVRAVRKGDRNTQQGYAFRGIDAVVNAVGPALRTHGVVVVPLLEEAAYRDVTTSTGKPSRECTVRVRYRFYGPAGDHIDCVTPGESMDFGDKGAPKAMSVAMRVALLQALCLPTDDKDPDAQSYERAEPEVDAASEDTPAGARARLAKLCEKHGLDLHVVAQEYEQRAKVPLGQETDVAAIRAFIDQIRKDPSSMMPAPVGDAS